MEGGTPASWLRPLKGESGTAQVGSGGGLNNVWLMGESVGTLGEVLEDGEQLSGCEVAGWLRVLILGTGPGVLTGVPDRLRVDWLSSHTDLWLDSSPSDMQGEGAPRLSTEGIENEPPFIPSIYPSPFCFIAFLCSVVLKCRLRCPELVNHLSQASH